MSGGFEMPHQTSKRKKQGFGGGKAKKPQEQAKTLTTGEAVARHMLLEYNAIKAEGGKVARVYARLKDTDEWLPVGNVRVLENSSKQLVVFLISSLPRVNHFTSMYAASNAIGPVCDSLLPTITALRLGEDKSSLGLCAPTEAKAIQRCAAMRRRTLHFWLFARP